MSSAQYIGFFYFIQGFVEFVAIQNLYSKKKGIIFCLEMLFILSKNFLYCHLISLFLCSESIRKLCLLDLLLIQDFDYRLQSKFFI